MDTWNSASDWHLPSPSTTPTSAIFDTSLRQTPKSDNFSTFFSNALATPRAREQGVAAVQTPIRVDTNIAQTPSSSVNSALTCTDDPSFHVNHFSPDQHLPLPPVEPARRLASSNNGPPFQLPQGPLSASQSSPIAVMNPSQIQTPPPTRDSSSRKTAVTGQPLIPSTPSTIASKRFSYPAGFGNSPSESLYFQTPMQFPALQFTPDMANLSNPGPATAPIFPQTGMFFDQSDGMDVDMPSSSDPFDPNPRMEGIYHNAWNTNDAITSGALQPRSFVANDDLVSSSGTNSFWTNDTSVAPSDPFGSAFMSDSSGVNPSMLFSFSKPADTSGTVSAHSKEQPTNAGRQPYEHQMQESNREKEMYRKARQSHPRTSTASLSTSTQAPARPGIQRSNTDSGFRKQEHASASLWDTSSTTTNTTNNNNPIPRKSSPLKRLSGSILAAIPETGKSRPKMRLVVDEDGRARTETVPPSETRKSEKRNSSQLSPSWDEDTSDTDSSSDVAISSQSNTFAFPRPPSRRSKLARNSFTGSRPSTATSNNFGQTASGPRTHGLGGGGSFDAGNSQSRRYSMSSFTSSFEDAKLRPETSMASDAGDAHTALQKVMESRSKRKENRKSLDQLQAHNQRWARASADLSKFPASSPITHSHPANASSSFSFGSFSSPAPHRSTATPPSANSSRHQNLAADGTRCICGSSSPANTPHNLNSMGNNNLVQCECCASFLHAACVGLNPRALPPVFVCVFCTGETPIARGGRVREPFRMQAAQRGGYQISPLAAGRLGR